MIKKNIKKLFINWWLTIDKTILSIYFIFLSMSLIFIFTSSTAVAERINVDSYYFFKHQLFFSFISSILLLSLSLFDDDLFKKFTKILFIISFILLLLVPFFGFQTKGAKRWIYIFNFSIQPTEIIKPTLILLNAYLLTKYKENDNKKLLIIDAIIFITSIFLIYKQPDIGTLILISAVFFLQIFLFDKITIKFSLILLSIMTLLIIIAYLTLPHVNDRINNFISSIINPENMNFQVRTSINAYKHSNLLGQGFMEGEIKNYIPDAHTDFILPAITEEFGFIVTFFIISLYFYLSFRIMIKAYKSGDDFKFLALYGLSCLFLFQAIINICVSLNLAPTKGMTLPLLSYGGSSLIGTSLNFAIILILTKKSFTTKIPVENILDTSEIV